MNKKILITVFYGIFLILFGDAVSADQRTYLPNLNYSEQHKPVLAENGMVVSQDIYASDVGRDILKKGGNAIDAAVATGFALAVTHPQAGNIGGGGFMLVYLAKEHRTIAIDYRETAPKAAFRDMLLGDDGNYDEDIAWYSGKSTGVPGTVMGLLQAHSKYGKLPREVILAPAIALASNGFSMTPALYDSLAGAKDRLKKDAATRRFFFKSDGSLYFPGQLFRQPELSKTLQSISDYGTDGFYKGQVAEQLITAVSENGGLMTQADLDDYQVVERAPVMGAYKSYTVVSMPPPSSGGVHIIQMMNILSGYDLKSMGHNSADYLHVLTESMRRAYADRSEYLGDPDFVDVPVKTLTSMAYANGLRDSIEMEQASTSEGVRPGVLFPESPETTHFSVMDSEGNAVSNTYTLNFTFGNGKSVAGAGFLMNNEMDDFSAKPGTPNGYGLVGNEANAVAPKKRPLSSMTPVIVIKDGRAFMVSGSPGGSTIINVTMQVVMNVLEFGMNPAQATAMPRIHHQWLPDSVFHEPGLSIDTLRLLEAKGQPVVDRSFWGGAATLGITQTIVRGEDGVFQGAADPRGHGSKASGY